MIKNGEDEWQAREREEAETRHEGEDIDDAEPLCQTDTEIGETRCCRV